MCKKREKDEGKKGKCKVKTWKNKWRGGGIWDKKVV
jgi:hypothetical protein